MQSGGLCQPAARQMMWSANLGRAHRPRERRPATTPSEVEADLGHGGSDAQFYEMKLASSGVCNMTQGYLAANALRSRLISVLGLGRAWLGTCSSVQSRMFIQWLAEPLVAGLVSLAAIYLDSSGTDRGVRLCLTISCEKSREFVRSSELCVEHAF
jgi:hypothetical protein